MKISRESVQSFLLTVSLSLFGVQSFAQPGGASAANAGLEQAAAGIAGSFDTVVKIMYAVCAIIGIVGGISVYSAWSNGDPDTRKKAASWFGALIFAGLVVVVLQAVFGV